MMTAATTNGFSLAIALAIGWEARDIHDCARGHKHLPAELGAHAAIVGVASFLVAGFAAYEVTDNEGVAVLTALVAAKGALHALGAWHESKSKLQSPASTGAASPSTPTSQPQLADPTATASNNRPTAQSVPAIARSLV